MKPLKVTFSMGRVALINVKYLSLLLSKSGVFRGLDAPCFLDIIVTQHCLLLHLFEYLMDVLLK